MKKILLYLLLSINSVTFSQSNWEWLNPKTSGLAGNVIYFINDEVGFLLNSEYLLKTENGGITWFAIENIINGGKMKFNDSVGFIIGDRGIVYKSENKGNTWNKVELGFDDFLNSVSIIHKDTILITSSNKLFKTKDGGKSWIKKDVSSATIIESTFTSSNVGHAACKEGTIIKTDDGGVNWKTTESVSTFPSDFYRITFVNESIGFASREHSELFKTIDGGETWMELDIPDAIYSFHFINDKIGFAAGEHGAIHKTQNGGNSWQWVGFDGRKYANNIYSIFFTNKDIGYATGLKGRIIKTEDGGNTWQEHAPSYYDINDIEFPSDTIGYTTAGTNILKTLDGGSNWSMQTVSPYESVYELKFVDEEYGFAIAGKTLYKTIDGGLTWEEKYITLHVNGIYAIDFVNRDTGFVALGWVYKTQDGGDSWEKLADYYFDEIDFVTNNVGFARTRANFYRKIYKTVDGGVTWQEKFEITKDINEMHYVNENIGYIVGESGVAYKTIDGGDNWFEMDIPYNDYISVDFYDNNIGFVTTDSRTVYKTTNGGETWSSNSVNSFNNFVDVTDNGDVFIAGSFGSILKHSLFHTKLISIDDVNLISITDTTAKVNCQISLSYDIANLKCKIGEESSVYFQSFDIVTLNGETDKNLTFDIHDLEPGVTYFFRLKAISGLNIFESTEISFTTTGEKVTNKTDNLFESNILIYPNPTNNSINIDPNLKKINIEIINTNGNILFKEEISEILNLDISSLPSGVYLLKAFQKNNIIVKKIIKY